MKLYEINAKFLRLVDTIEFNEEIGKFSAMRTNCHIDSIASDREEIHPRKSRQARPQSPCRGSLKKGRGVALGLTATSLRKRKNVSRRYSTISKRARRPISAWRPSLTARLPMCMCRTREKRFAGSSATSTPLVSVFRCWKSQEPRSRSSSMQE